MSAAAQLEALPGGGLAIWLDGQYAAHVPPGQAPWVETLLRRADGDQARRLLLTGIVAGLHLAKAGAPA